MNEIKLHKHGGDVYRHEKIVDFSANINFRGMPTSVMEAAQKAITFCGKYPDTECEDLRKAIGLREHIAPEKIICGNGAADLIFSLVLAVKPKEALLLAPTFFEYEQALSTVECRINKHYLQENREFQLDDSILKNITHQTDILFICNPNNPTGMVTDRRLLINILNRCEECGTWLVIDECFLDFLEDSDRYTMKTALEHWEKLFILKAFTKMYAMAGLRLGYGLCGNAELLQKMTIVRQPWSVSIPAQKAGIAAAQEIDFAQESADILNKERMKIIQMLKEKGYQVLDSKANFVFFKGPEGLYDSCLEQGFMIRDCSNYEGLTQGWYRIAVKSPEDNERLLSVL